MPDSSMRRGASCRPDFLLYASRFVDDGQWRMNEGRSVICGSSLVGAGPAPDGRGSALVIGWLALVLGPGRWSDAGGVAGGVAASAWGYSWTSTATVEAEILSDASVSAMVEREKTSPAKFNLRAVRFYTTVRTSKLRSVLCSLNLATSFSYGRKFKRVVQCRCPSGQIRITCQMGSNESVLTVPEAIGYDTQSTIPNHSIFLKLEDHAGAKV